MSIYAFDTARIISPDQFKKSSQRFHRKSGSELNLSLSQQRERLARALGFSSFHGLKNNDSIIIEYNRMIAALEIYDSTKQVLFECFFCSSFINTGAKGTLCLAVNGLRDEGSYVALRPYVDHGQGLYSEGFDYIPLGKGIALPLDDWKALVDEVKTELEQSMNSDSVCENIVHRFNQIETVQSYFDPESYISSYPELEKAVAENQSQSGIRKVLADWYSLENDFSTPLSELISFCKDRLYLSS